ncbi:hypothetical protein K504DRAFT_241660 [Pleomassaria siparia CBS 279.74]|uniref:Uncharacterized protein n=1 Tax=Pleomassaria siparia CBS 279.74 TaxID=1314801 RepID=A0A6G1KEU2_9PLEO|nr:hypothetical protein K504DRAFT_241660 [Pleomassaria siparia CBS 279.74]
MTGMFDTVRDYAQSHPMSVAAGLIIALPGAYLFLSKQSTTCTLGLCKNVSTTSQSTVARVSEDVSIYESQHPLDLRLNLPVSRWSDKPDPTFLFQVIQAMRNSIIRFVTATSERLGIDINHMLQFLEDHWATHFPLRRFALVAATTALPGAFVVFIRKHPDSWAAKHQTQVANALHVLALITVANQQISVQDLLVTALVMVSFEVFQRSLGPVSTARDDIPSAIETLLATTHSVVAESDIVVPVSDAMGNVQEKAEKSPRDSTQITCQEEQILLLERQLTETRTSEKVKEIELKRAQSDLQNARDTLNETFTEYTSLRDEMKTVKQAMGRDHQAIIYRKDIELFALRKGNEQKEICIKEKEARLESIQSKHSTVLELKDEQLQNLRERVAFLERKDTHEIPTEMDKASAESDIDVDHSAIQVKLLRVRGRNSIDTESSIDEKDMEIAKLKGDLASAATSAEALAHKQDELRRAWDATYEVQNSLSKEQQMHVQTRERLQEITVRLEEELRRNCQKDSPTRLPTIEEQDKKELETMFNAAQQDNLRLYAEMDVLDKRLREANARVFVCDQEIENLKEQLRLEKAINEDMETARPSLVHRVHYQRMEGQLKESKDVLETKDDEIARLKKEGATKSGQVEELQKAKEEASKLKIKAQEESEELRKTIKDLEQTKEQLMLDHERLASQRTRTRTTSAEHTSARSSGTTLITDPPQVIRTSDEPLPNRPVTLVENPAPPSPRPLAEENGIQNIPQSTYPSDTNRISMISDNVPPTELRTTRKKRFSLKSVMKKLTDRDAGPTSDHRPKSSKGKEAIKEMPRPEMPRPKTAMLAPKDKNTLMRPKTAAVPLSLKESGKDAKKEVVRPQTAAPVPTPRPTPAFTEAKEKKNKAPQRYYTAQETQIYTRDQGDKEDSGVDASSPGPKSSGWSTSRKLIRKSVG